MDRKFVKRKINEFFGRYEYKELLDRVAEAIVAQHEAEIEKKDAALRELDTALERLCAQHEAEVVNLKAQVAVMGEALRLVEWQPQFNSYGDRYSDKCPRCHEHIEVGHAKDCEIGQALSAAPKVLYSGDTPIYRTGEGAPWLDLSDWKHQFVNGTIYSVIVCSVEPACSHNTEQAQESEREE